MTEINAFLNEIADEQIQAETDFDFDAMMDALMDDYLMRMAAANSYDMDAVYYGMEGVK